MTEADRVWEETKELWETSAPQWTCRPWNELFDLKGVRWCAEHDLPLEIVALDDVSRICRIGAERDTYEFSMQRQRSLVRRGVKVAPGPWAPSIQNDIDRGNGHLYDPRYEKDRQWHLKSPRSGLS